MLKHTPQSLYTNDKPTTDPTNQTSQPYPEAKKGYVKVVCIACVSACERDVMKVLEYNTAQK